MLLKKIKLKDFRQFKGEQTVSFASDPIKNVTVIMGENGSGKTALAQSFTWCLYGETSFEDKNVLCKATLQEMLPNSEEIVKVEIELIHKDIEYIITREQRYKKDGNGQLKRPNNTTFTISYKKSDGQIEFIKELETELRMNEILPKELSRYFFFDGERIDNMSKEIHKGKSQEFAQAVKSLLGLNGIIFALEHLNGRTSKSVIRLYDDSYDLTSDIKISDYTKKIEELEQKIDTIEERLNNIESEENIAKEKCDDLREKIIKNKESNKLVLEKEGLYKKIDDLKQFKTKTITSLLKSFNKGAQAYFAKKLMRDALKQLAYAEKLDKGIPDIHERTIDYLIKRGECLCGNKILEGNDAYKKLKELIEFIPPQSIGTLIREFVNECENRSKNAENYFNDISEHYKTLRDIQNDFVKTEEEIKLIEELLQGMENVGELQKEFMRYSNILKELKAERDKLNRDRGAYEKEKNYCEAGRKELALKDENNKKIETYKAYAKYIYNELNKIYKDKETEVRTKLEEKINQKFKYIYKGGLSLSIDEKYNIQVIVDDYKNYNDDVETSTAQSISIIFAFIAGVIEMARETKTNDNNLLVSEPYPLVMDAPLSSFDKTRIKTICEILPETAEQVIIMIKDTDGEIAEQHLSEKIGYYYLLDKKNEFFTDIIKK